MSSAGTRALLRRELYAGRSTLGELGEAGTAGRRGEVGMGRCEDEAVELALLGCRAWLDEEAIVGGRVELSSRLRYVGGGRGSQFA